jgi:hypothetical protein
MLADAVDPSCQYVLALRIRRNAAQLSLTPTRFGVERRRTRALNQLFRPRRPHVNRRLARCRRNPLILQVVWRIVRPALRV